MRCGYCRRPLYRSFCHASIRKRSGLSGVLRIECMPLDCGGAAIVVELDRTPERTWMKSLKRALQADDALEGAQAKFDGRFVYVVGVDGVGTVLNTA